MRFAQQALDIINVLDYIIVNLLGHHHHHFRFRLARKVWLGSVEVEVKTLNIYKKLVLENSLVWVPP